MPSLAFRKFSTQVLWTMKKQPKQTDDEELKELRSKLDLEFKDLRFPALRVNLTCKTSTGKFRPNIPKEFRKLVFEATHGLVHSGED